LELVIYEFVTDCPPTPLKEQKSAEVIEKKEAEFWEVQKSKKSSDEWRVMGGETKTGARFARERCLREAGYGCF